jgi:hypothetical protein
VLKLSQAEKELIKTTKEYLKRARGLERKIRAAEESLREKRESLYCGTRRCQFSGVKTNSCGSSEIGVENVVDSESETERLIEGLAAEYAEIKNAIYAVDDERGFDILERRYLKGQPWKKIYAEMNHGKRYIYDLHILALKNIALNRTKSHLTAL